MIIDSGHELLRVLETEFGPIDTGFLINENPVIQIVRYNTNKIGIEFISTLGMSKLDNKPNLEWYMEFIDTQSSDTMASLLSYYASIYIQNKMLPPKRGSYVVFSEGEGLYWKKNNACGLYFTHPFYRNHSLLTELEDCCVILVWVVPIVQSELHILETQGWQELEHYWNTKDVNLRAPFRD